MQVTAPRRLTGPATLIVALAALAGCGAGGNGAAAGAAPASARPSTAASASALPSTPAKPPATAASASASAKPSGTASAAPATTPSAAASTPRAAQTPAALLDSAIAAMQAQTSVHIACTESNSSGVLASSTDFGVASGRVASTQGTVSITNMVVNGVAYLNTNTAGIWVSEGIPQAEAVKLVTAGDWLSIKPGQSYGHVYLSYANAAAAASVAGQANLLRLTGSLERAGATSVQGVSVYGVSGGGPASYGKGVTESVYIAATGAPLPVSETMHASGDTTTCNYSGWGEPLHLTAPTNVVPITSIPAS